MNALVLRHPSEHRTYALCLACSLVLHAVVVAGGIALVAGLELAPQPEPFRWEVSVVGPGGVSEGPPPPTVTREMQQAQSEPVRAPQSVPPPKQAPLKTVVPKPPVEELAKATPSEPPAEPLSQASKPSASVAPVPEPVPAFPPSEPVVASRAPSEAPAAAVGVVPSDPSPDATAESPRSTPNQPSASAASVQTAPPGSSDYGWIADALWKRIEQLKRYPHLARINRLEGKVVLRAVIKADGQLVDLEVAKSSGHSVLDHDALDVLRRASPLALTRPLGKPQMVVQIPISYQLDR